MRNERSAEATESGSVKSRESEKVVLAVAEGGMVVEALLRKRQIQRRVILLADLVCGNPVENVSKTW